MWIITCKYFLHQRFIHALAIIAARKLKTKQQTTWVRDTSRISIELRRHGMFSGRILNISLALLALATESMSQLSTVVVNILNKTQNLVILRC